MAIKPGQEIVVKIPENTPKRILELLEIEWVLGGAERFGEILILGVEDKLVDVKEVAEKYGYTRRWVGQLAREAAKSGEPWPIMKQGKWQAPLTEWEKIFVKNAEKKKRRGRRQKKTKD